MSVDNFYYYDIAISKSPLLRTFTYKSEYKLAPGMRVLVNFANRDTLAYVLDELIQSDKEKITSDISIKNIIDTIDVSPIICDEYVHVAKLCAQYFITPIGKVMDLFFSNSPQINIKTKIIKLALKEDLLGFEIKEGSVELSDFISRLGKNRYKPILKEYLENKKVHIMYGINTKKISNKMEKIIYLNVDLEYIMQAKLSPVSQDIVDYLLLVGEDTQKNIINKLQIKSKSSIETLYKKGIIKYDLVPVEGDDYKENKNFIELNSLQKNIINTIEKDIKENKLKHLIYGITGSGKTEIYFEIMEKILNENKKILYLLPEISLTPQMISRVKNRFKEHEIGIYHSFLKKSQRIQTWNKVISSQIDIIIGTRSALWLPFKDLGLIIMDEEHDDSYMQTESEPVYDSKHISAWLSDIKGIPVVYGSATPRFESYYAAREKNEIQLHTILSRPLEARLPEIKVIDILHTQKINWYFSKELIIRMEETLRRRKQIFILVGKKGYNSFLSCDICGYVFKCENCSVSLTYHMYSKQLKCHYCGYKRDIPIMCPSCNSQRIQRHGYGSERIENELIKLFPEEKVLRIDRENINNLEELNQAFEQIKENNVQIIVGTKMISKGLDFPNVELVAILNADQYLFFPDFRAPEKTFQLLSQMSGRAGRIKTDEGTKVIIQTTCDEKEVINYSAKNDFISFYNYELVNRKTANYPPFSHIILLNFSSYEVKSTANIAQEFVDILKDKLNKEKEEILGPVPAYIEKIAGLYRYHCIIKSFDIGETIDKITQILKTNNKYNNYIKIIVDPIKMLI